LEQLLALFDQSGMTNDPHFLAINEEQLPEQYRPLLRRLQKAVADPVVRQTMDAEDDLIEDFKDYQRMISIKEQIISAREQTISEKDQTISEKDQTISEKDQTIFAQQKTLQMAIRNLHIQGMDVLGIAVLFNLTEAEVQHLLESDTDGV
jgi:uncharacterized protein (DUF3084 family)